MSRGIRPQELTAPRNRWAREGFQVPTLHSKEGPQELLLPCHLLEQLCQGDRREDRSRYSEESLPSRDGNEICEALSVQSKSNDCPLSERRWAQSVWQGQAKAPHS